MNPITSDKLHLNKLRSLFSKTNLKNFKTKLSQAYDTFLKNNVFSLASSISYYTVLSLTPFLILFFAALLFFGWKNVPELQQQIASNLGPSATLIVESLRAQLKSDKGGFSLGVFGFITLVFAASGIVTELKMSLELILLDRQEKPKVEASSKSLIWQWIKGKFSSVAVLAFCIFISTVSLVFSTVLGLFFSNEGVFIWKIINFFFSIGFFSVIFFFMFHYLTQPNMTWKFSIRAAILCSIFFHIGKFTLEAYFTSSSIESSYGALSSFIVLLLWAYYNALIILSSACLAKAFFYDKTNN